ncbi:MAG: hypothetical protein JW929_00710 [Anaerolineales bacterium]|nr:hypothetical protein [Anaerolineales bacterium]
MKCSRCGVESGVEEAFTVRREWVGLVKRAYCPPCWETVYLRRQFFTIAVAIALFLALDALIIGRGAALVLLDFLFLGILNLLLAAAHELAHAAAGLLLGLRIFRVIIGFGKPLAVRRRFGITWELRPWLFGAGTVLACPPRPGCRWRMFLAIAAGPGIHALLLLAAVVFRFFLLLLQGWLGIDAVLALHLTGLFLYFDLVLLFFNLIPMRAGGLYRQAGTDGLQMLDQLLMPPERQASMNQGYYLMEAMDAGSRNDPQAALDWLARGLEKFPGHPMLLTTKGVNLIRRKQFAAAREVFLALRDSPEAEKPFFRSLILNNIAYVDALIRGGELLAEAERCSEEAFRNLPWEPSIVGTRGMVLAETGRLKEGISLLKRALAGQIDPSARAADAYHLADALRRLGNAGESRRYFALARRWDPDFFLLDPADC